MQQFRKLILCSAIASVLAAAAQAASAGPAQTQAGVDRLRGENPGAKVSVNPATGTARFIRLGPASLVRQGTVSTEARAEKSAAYNLAAATFINRNAAALGLRTGMSDLSLRGADTDKLGQTRLTYDQKYSGLPVFGAVLKAHFDSSGRLKVVNGTLIPDIDVSATPNRSASDAEAVAKRHVNRKGVSALSSRLLVFREGLARGVPGATHLAYEVEVGNRRNVREFVYVDAHSGKVIDQITGVYDAMYRRAYNGLGLPQSQIPTFYPGNPYWVEGDAYPTAIAEANNMIEASKETYDLYFNGFGRDSFDGAGAVMDAIFNRGYSCPNASWNGIFISFCPGITTDDVTGHEWSHAYTQYTDDLIYQWQPGALNEASSDVFGETLDRLNNRGGDSPDNPRTADSCSVQWGTPPPGLIITGGSAAGSYVSRASVNEPPKPFTVGPTPMAIASSAPPFQATGACGPVSGVSGKIAIVDWTLVGTANECGSGARAANALAGGATGIIFVAPASGPLNLGSLATIASVQVLNADGAAIKAGLPADATMSMTLGTDNSIRWLVGEDSTAPGLVGALRDMWNPRCFGNPGKVTDVFEYACSTADGGGVHTNSGVDNHAYALMVDGGSYNGQTITGIGLTKAAHVYFRAKTHYQGPATDFADHADALEQSCADLTGTNLASLTTGGPSGEILSAADCSQVHKALLAVEMRTPPSQCGFVPLLAKNPPANCPAGKSAKNLFIDRFENGTSSMDRFIETHDAVFPADFTDRDWLVTGGLPEHRAGRAFYGVDYVGGTCAPGGDESGVLHLDSPVITVPANSPVPRVAFDHWVATEAGWDGGNVKISVNGGPWTLIPASAFLYNTYNGTLQTVAAGNTNPLAGQRAFTGSDGGSVDGSWGRSIIDLTGIAKAKDKIRLRFDMGQDGCTGTYGWYVDDLKVYQCR